MNRISNIWLVAVGLLIAYVGLDFRKRVERNRFDWFRQFRYQT
jgi:hypothetical protein